MSASPKPVARPLARSPQVTDSAKLAYPDGIANIVGVVGVQP